MNDHSSDCPTAWGERILKAAEHDPYVAEAFGSVTDLLAPPTVLMRPRLVWRVALSRTEKHVVRAKKPVRSRKPSTVNAASSPRCPSQLRDAARWPSRSRR